MFEEVLFFQTTYNIKTEKQTINSTYLVSVRCVRLTEGKGHETEKEDFLENLHVLSRFVQLKSVLSISCVFWTFLSERWQSTLF